MAGGPTNDGATYSLPVGAMYIFNLIVGAGALALPKAFEDSGLIGGESGKLLLFAWRCLWSGTILISVLALFSFITVSFMIEAMSLANAVRRRDKQEAGLVQTDTSPLLTGIRPISISFKPHMIRMACGISL